VVLGGVRTTERKYLDSIGLFKDAIIAILAAIAGAPFRAHKGWAGPQPKKPGRPTLDMAKVAGLRRLRGKEFSFIKIQVATGVPVVTIHKYIRG
jgi:hypothetical protein